MKAVRIHNYGWPRVLTYEDAPQPEPKEEELLIRVHATSVNPADWQIRSGRRFKLRKPFSLILGAAALPVVALTAWQALFDAAKLSAGQTMLIHAAAGGVGHIAAQLAKWKGAHVIGTASGRNESFLREIGVDEFINYRTTRFEDVIQSVDVVLESINRDIPVEAFPGETLERSWGVLKKGGVLVSICAGPSFDTAAEYGVRGVHVSPPAQKNEILAEIAKLVDAGHIKPFISTVLPLKETRKAHKISQKGHTRGKIVLKVIESDI